MTARYASSPAVHIAGVTLPVPSGTHNATAGYTRLRRFGESNRICPLILKESLKATVLLHMTTPTQPDDVADGVVGGVPVPVMPVHRIFWAAFAPTERNALRHPCPLSLLSGRLALPHRVVGTHTEGTALLAKYGAVMTSPAKVRLAGEALRGTVANNFWAGAIDTGFHMSQYMVCTAPNQAQRHQ